MAGNLEKNHLPTPLCGNTQLHCRFHCIIDIWTKANDTKVLWAVQWIGNVKIWRKTHVHLMNTIIVYYNIVLLNTQYNTKCWRWELIPQIVWVRWDNREDGDAIGDGIQEWRMPEFHSALSDHPGPEYALGPILAGIWKWVVSKNQTQVLLLFVCLYEKLCGQCWSVNMHVYAWERSPLAEAGGRIFMRAPPAAAPPGASNFCKHKLRVTMFS